ncbi:Lymphocyte antigen 96 [Buceros rhinoceros silvestris]|uniref:Lymphocyte antigen 96 n=1 Tax=Buceros rhinoceros silvestris TaxID=175836 RepID=A0A091H884_BUCRH|nr:PREDICTED: lymphocyte antigen 96 [Buceros rhinoceros silvestris]KFO91659.1 Lymphocyte antigen 96 [Buceros rhinoceros silvestris]
MFGLFFFIFFTPGVSEFLCTSSDLEISYTFCDSAAHVFMFNVTPCSIVNKTVWKANLTWIPRSDITFLKVVFNVWYEGINVLHWKETLCSGADDEYSVCGALKGETTATAFDIKGSRIKFPKGNYNIILQGFSDHFENDVVMCLNFTMIVKQDSF